MLVTIVRALFLFVVLCLVSATRPIARTNYDDPGAEARFEVAKGNVLVAARRDSDQRDPRDQRALALAIPVVAFTVVPPRPPLSVEQLAPPRAVVPIIFARSSRGPPVG